MQSGMLWFDNDPKTTLILKVERAAGYYQQKYGQVPNLCLVHPSMLQEKMDDTVTLVAIRPYDTILPGHLWIGIEQTA